MSEADYAGIPVVGARVEATGGQSAGVQTTTAPDGRYRLYGVAGDTTLNVGDMVEVLAFRELALERV